MGNAAALWCKRDNNSKMFKSFGANAGCDCIDSYTPSAQLADLLNGLQEADALPKTILYSLNPIDNAAIGSVMGCFQHGPEAGYIQQGSAWWFNDNKTGITEQLTSLANQGLLGCFVGMLTDSRSFVSYTRHEYFRRILCNLIGNLVEMENIHMMKARLVSLLRISHTIIQRIIFILHKSIRILI